ncbi:MAG: histidine kinase [Fischerella sp. CENA71]|nr:histidine kinase [Fischerella sp. CENA71]
MSKQGQNERLIQKLRERIARLEQENRQCQTVQQEMCEEQKRVQKLAKAAQERAAEMTKANDALRRSVNVLATESNLNQFIGHVLQVTAEQFDAPLAEYWQVTNPNIGQVVGWWGHNQIHGFGEEHNHPAKAPGVRFPPHMLENGQFSTRRTHFVAPFDHSVEPIQGEFLCDPQAWYRAYDAYWQLNLPLVIGETCFGVIIFWLPSARSFTKQQVELGYALAQQITLAIRLCQLADEAKLSAVAREQEKAAQQQAYELVKANQALKRSIIHLTTAKSLHSFLVAILQEACQASGATCASVFVYEASSNTLRMNTLILDNQVIDIATDPRAAIWHFPVPANTTKYWQMISQDRKIFWSTSDNLTPEHWEMATVWHQQMQHKAIAAIPLLIGEQILGFLGLYFTTTEQPNQSKTEQCSTLAQHAALALQMAQFAEQAKQEAEQAAILQERNRIAREIHDTLAQCLTGIIIQLQTATDSHTANSLNHIAIATEMAKSGLTEARRSVRALRPQVLEAVSLDAALAQLVSQIQSDRLHSNCRILGTPYTLPVEVESNLLRIAQEAFTNCIRHAKATQVKLDLVYQPEQVTLRIKDNGCGFSPSLTTQGYGLVGMWERARAITANLTITSQPNEGTDVVVILSISQVDT